MVQAPSELAALVFDLDGTIFDSREANVAFYDYVLDELGLPQTASEHADILHRASMKDSFKHLFGEEEGLFRRAMEVWRNMETGRFFHLQSLFPGVRSTLAALARRYPLGVATNRARTTRASLRHFGLLDLFTVIVTPLEAGVSKPDPKLMEMVLSGLKLAPEQVLYVGDSIVDQEMCRAAGVRWVAFRAPQLEAWAHLEQFTDLLTLLEHN